MFSAVPAGLGAKSNAFPALKRRAIFRLSLRDKVVCANFILFFLLIPIARISKDF
jgi:hypothetical protein